MRTSLEEPSYTGSVVHSAVRKTRNIGSGADHHAGKIGANDALSLRGDWMRYVLGIDGIERYSMDLDENFARSGGRTGDVLHRGGCGASIKDEGFHYV
jgi:hypothetical protein